MSVIPPSAAERRYQQDSLTLRAVNNSTIATHSTRLLTLDFGLRRTFRWVFTLADVRNPILGADFLHYYRLPVNMSHHRLTDASTQLSVQGIASQASALHPTPLPLGLDFDYLSILPDFPDITQLSSCEVPVKHSVTHHIVTSGPPPQFGDAHDDCPLSVSEWHAKSSSI